MVRVRVRWLLVGMLCLGAFAHAASPDGANPVEVATRMTAALGGTVVAASVPVDPANRLQPDRMYTFTPAGGALATGSVISRDWPLRDAPFVWVRDPETPGRLRILVPTAQGLMEMDAAADASLYEFGKHLHPQRTGFEPGAELPRRMSRPLAGGRAYLLSSEYMAQWRAQRAVQTIAYAWVADDRFWVVTHWVTGAPSAEAALAYLTAMTADLPANWLATPARSTRRR